MPTVDKTWVFASDNEGLVDEGVSAWTINHDAAGNPGGSLEFGATSLNGTFQEKARRSSTGETWETWGVPAGSVVTDLQIVSWDYNCWAVTSITSYTFKMRIVDSAGVTVHSAGELVNLALSLGSVGAWVAGGAGTSRAVDAAKQASTTDVRLEIDGTVVTSANNFADVGLDNILLRMTYAAAPVASNIYLYWTRAKARRGRRFTTLAK